MATTTSHFLTYTAADAVPTNITDSVYVSNPSTSSVYVSTASSYLGGGAIVTNATSSMSPTETVWLSGDTSGAYTDVSNVQQLAIIIGVTVGLAIILILSIWWCCCCCRKKKKRRRLQQDAELAKEQEFIEVVENVAFCEHCGNHGNNREAGDEHSEMSMRHQPLLNPFASSEQIHSAYEAGEQSPDTATDSTLHDYVAHRSAPEPPPRRKPVLSARSPIGGGPSTATESETDSRNDDYSSTEPTTISRVSILRAPSHAASNTSSEMRALRQLTIPESWQRHSSRMQMTLQQKRDQEKFLIMPEPPYSSDAIRTLAARPLQVKGG